MIIKFVTLNCLIQLLIQFWPFVIEYSLLYKQYELEIETKH